MSINRFDVCGVDERDCIAQYENGRFVEFSKYEEIRTEAEKTIMGLVNQIADLNDTVKDLRSDKAWLEERNAELVDDLDNAFQDFGGSNNHGSF